MRDTALMLPSHCNLVVDRAHFSYCLFHTMSDMSFGLHMAPDILAPFVVVPGLGSWLCNKISTTLCPFEAFKICPPVPGCHMHVSPSDTVPYIASVFEVSGKSNLPQAGTQDCHAALPQEQHLVNQLYVQFSQRLFIHGYVKWSCHLAFI